jgi:hypothetical protein
MIYKTSKDEIINPLNYTFDNYLDHQMAMIDKDN